ncbi:isochorismatase hydrolase [Aspergillus sclerotioniger CBS 115572]|uniref:Isochorismatase hydrolase n=1 Tax=Aspergillus sclerotioniger CBS 115572 TaxID=1450535 RepID=A0A317X925_9EURO|nr:isochorismatase hydrolase [Aspergillus sclerotioniger CBS 115572]PWY93428.1 isochorismatase hydrolase [Aspergillus sclerotioniger CBS 115572]
MSSRTALFTIDIQNELSLNPQTRIPHADRILTASTEILKTARSIIDAHRETNRPSPSIIVFVQHEESPTEGGTLIKGSEAWELAFGPRDGVEEEVLVSKTTGDTFKSNRNLAQKLRAAGVTDIVVFGLQSEACVEATCTGALAAGFRVTLLAGAHSTYDDQKEGKMAVEVEREVERRLSTRGVRVLSWEKAVAGWVERQRVG